MRFHLQPEEISIKADQGILAATACPTAAASLAEGVECYRTDQPVSARLAMSKRCEQVFDSINFNHLHHASCDVRLIP